MQKNDDIQPTSNDLQKNLLTSSDFHEVKDIEVVLEDEEYKEYKYRSNIKSDKVLMVKLIDLL